MLDDAAKFLLRPGKKSGNVLERDQRNIECVAEAHKTRALYRSIDVQHAGEKCRLISDNTHGAPVEPGKSHDEIFGKMFVDFEQISVIHNGMNRVLDVVRLLWIVRNQRVQRLIAALDGIGTGAPRR